MALPSREEVFLEISLYNIINLEEVSLSWLYSLFYTEDTIDSYCMQCEKYSTFKPQIVYPTFWHHGANHKADNFKLFNENIGNKHFNNIFKEINFYCSRNPTHQIKFDFYITNSYLIKIGQFPSLADSFKIELRKYEPVLEKEKHKEFSRGIHLAASGIGIGSFVYFRRIIEFLIENCYKENRDKIDPKGEKFLKLKYTYDKIDFLSNYLPEFLVDNKHVWKILNKGIHELTEEECLDIFPPLKSAIEIILDQELERIIREKKIKEAKSEISKINQKIAKKNKENTTE